MKWILIIITITVGYMIIDENMGGAKEATSNYNKVLTEQKREK